MKPALIILLALPLAGCNLEALENKPSPYKAAHEQRMALVTPVVASVAIAEADPVSDIEPVVISEPSCKPIYRVQRCNGNNPIPWSM